MRWITSTSRRPVHFADLTRMALVLTADGTNPITGKELIPRPYVQIAKTFMVTCGMYNGAGEFAIGVAGVDLIERLSREFDWSLFRE